MLYTLQYSKLPCNTRLVPKMLEMSQLRIFSHVSCGAALPLFVRHCLFCCLAPLGLASHYPQSIAISTTHRDICDIQYPWCPISVISNICDIRDTRPPSRYRQPTVISVISNIREIQYLRYLWYPSTIAISSPHTLNWHMVLEGFPYALNDILCFTQISPQFLYSIFPYNSNAWKRKLERQLLIHTYSFTASAAVTLPISLSYFNEQHENWFNLNIPDTIK